MRDAQLLALVLESIDDLSDGAEKQERSCLHHLALQAQPTGCFVHVVVDVVLHDDLLHEHGAFDVAVVGGFDQLPRPSCHLTEREASRSRGAALAVGQSGELEGVGEFARSFDQVTAVPADQKREVLLEGPNPKFGDGQVVMVAMHLGRTGVEQ
jgi:hypothetical protein